MSNSTTIPRGVLPSLPAKHAEFLSYLAENPNLPISELIKPYKEYEAKLRELYAQEKADWLQEPALNVLPLFVGHEDKLVTRARDLESESDDEKEKYVMPLDADARRSNGSPATVRSFKEFQNNFNLFSESALVDMNWSNVLVAGSAVVTSLMPVAEEHAESKRALRQFYHEEFAPASDVDLFLYGLTEEEAIEKIKEIETSVKDSILYETTTIRTKNAITIASQYPTRHIQIVLRIYKSMSEILTGFDVDCSCIAYDGKQVYATPRAIAAAVTQINPIDLTRRSPSYENRLSKYSRRGFEVYWPMLDRSRIDPTIFERNFARTMGLARLLVLEKLPKVSEREAYQYQRREERGRPQPNMYSRNDHKLAGNIKDAFEDEAAEWVEEDEVSNYHTFTVPYGERFHAKKIEKLLYTKDLLLNAEWNKPKDREVNLHRHPAFFGRVEDVIKDCCLFCPKPVTEDDKKVAEEESKVFVSGDITFLSDDPGRQMIGSFNPITDQDWTEMAYVGNTARLCHAIVDCDYEHVEDWLAGEDADVNRRDYTGRTPLQLAIMTSTPKIVKLLVDHGARMVSRLADGRTAIHIAAQLGNTEMIKILMDKSDENEEVELEKEDHKRAASTQQTQSSDKTSTTVVADKNDEDSDGEGSDGEDGEMIEREDDDEHDVRSTTTGSYVKVEKKEEEEHPMVPEDDDLEDPDIIDINVLAWDLPYTPLHFAIVSGHIDAVKSLVQNHGADVLLPVKSPAPHYQPTIVVMTLVLALCLPSEKAKEMAKTLLELGASCAQADMNHKTVFHEYLKHSLDLVEVLFENDMASVNRVLNYYIADKDYSFGLSSSLGVALRENHTDIALRLLEAGAKINITFDDWVKAYENQNKDRLTHTNSHNRENFLRSVDQPIIDAVQSFEPEIALKLIAMGVDVNCLTKRAQGELISQRDGYGGYYDCHALLDLVRENLKSLREYNGERNWLIDNGAPLELRDDDFYLSAYKADIVDGTFKSYEAYIAYSQLQKASKSYKVEKKAFDKELKEQNDKPGLDAKKEKIQKLIVSFEKLESLLVEKEAKTFEELYPEMKKLAQSHGYREIKRTKEEFKINMSFSIPELTDESKEGYAKLFEAAWVGDLATIKSLTLFPWGENEDRFPLKIAVQDTEGLSPFAISVLRGHRDVARSILEIAQVQYKPKEQTRTEKFSIQNENEDTEYSDEEMSDDDRSETDFRISGRIFDDQFTIDNIGEISLLVKSDIQAYQIVNSTLYFDAQAVSGHKCENGSKAATLIQWAVANDDMDLFNFIIEEKKKCLSWCKVQENEQPPVLEITDLDFQHAIKIGNTRFLSEMIKHCGAGLALETLIEDSGVELKKKAKYYQGLSVYGKKREDWAAAARGIEPSTKDSSDPLFLVAANMGSLASVEWFRSDAPLNRYVEFAAENKGDTRIEHLSKVPGGFEKAVSRWLGARNELALSCAVLSTPEEGYDRLFKYLINVIPSSLDAKSTNGYTPLQIAFYLRNIPFARSLIEAGANIRARTKTGDNLIHLVLRSIRNARPSTDRDVDALKGLLELIDPEIRKELFLERSSEEPGALTPLHSYVCQDGYSDKESEDVVKRVLEFSGGAELGLYNGAGETILHTVVNKCKTAYLPVLLQHNPELLFIENASGQTALELATQKALLERTQNYREYNRYSNRNGTNPTQLPLENFLPESKKRTPIEQTYVLCVEAAKNIPRKKRKLVSLLDANEVAKRLAQREKDKSLKQETENHRRNRRGYTGRNRMHSVHDNTDGDEVDKFFTSIWGWAGQDDKIDILKIPNDAAKEEDEDN